MAASHSEPGYIQVSTKPKGVGSIGWEPSVDQKGGGACFANVILLSANLYQGVPIQMPGLGPFRCLDWDCSEGRFQVIPAPLSNLLKRVTAPSTVE